MGRDKANLPWRGTTMLDRMVCEMQKGGREILVSVASSGSQDHGFCSDPENPVFSERPDICIVADEYPDRGPLEGICCVLKASKAEAVFFCAVDMPFVTEQTVEYLEQFLCSDYDGVVFADSNRIHPLCGIYKKQALPVIEAQLASEDYRVMQLLDSCRFKQVRLELSSLSPRTLWNTNTPEEYARAVKPMVFCVSGVKNSGKTTMVEKLVHQLKADFSAIGVIKHDGHDFSMDAEGTDTYRAARAGACRTAIYSRYQSALLVRFQEEVMALDDVLERLIEQMQDLDVVILEGMKYSSYPKIELVRRGNSTGCAANPTELIAVVTDLEQPDGVPDGIPVLNLNDAAAIAAAIRRYFGL